MGNYVEVKDKNGAVYNINTNNILYLLKVPDFDDRDTFISYVVVLTGDIYIDITKEVYDRFMEVISND